MNKEEGQVGNQSEARNDEDTTPIQEPDPHASMDNNSSNPGNAACISMREADAQELGDQNDLVP